jgi:hypothetical protein
MEDAIFCWPSEQRCSPYHLFLVLSCLPSFVPHLHILSLHAHIKPSGLNITQSWRPRSPFLWIPTKELFELISTTPSQPSDLRPGRGPILSAGLLLTSQLPELLPSPPARWKHPPPPAARSLPIAPADVLPALLPATLALDHHHVPAATSVDYRASVAMAMALLPSAPALICAAEQSEKSVSTNGPPGTSLSWLNLSARVGVRLASPARSRRKTKTRSRTCCLWCRHRSSTN